MSKIYIGHNPENELAGKVLEYSIQTRQQSVFIEHVTAPSLKEMGLLTKDSPEEHKFIKYFVPYLNNYEGWAVYLDNHLLCNVNINDLLIQKQDQYAVMVIPRDWEDTRTSIIMFNCSHVKNKALTPETINGYTIDQLKSFCWLKPEDIGPFGHEYNWPIDLYKYPDQGIPKILNYSNGGPWIESQRQCLFGAYWEKEKNDYIKATAGPKPPHKFENLPQEINKIVDMMIEYRMDSNNEYYKVTKDDIMKEVETNLSPKRVFAVDSEFRYARKGNIYDPMLENFIIGAGGQITTWDMIENDRSPVVIRGIAKRKQIYSCWETKRDFYYIDTGYFGNGKRKLYHRITKNHLQNIYPIITRPRDRLSLTGWRPSKFRGGKNILICPPSAKVMKFFDLDLDQWMDTTLSTIKKYTDRPIVVRLKQSRSARMHDDTLAMALSRDVHCLVTFNSIAATEALLLGKPAFTMGPNAAHWLCKQDLAEIETPYIPTLDEVEEWAAHLSYAQFTEQEMRSGYAWAILNENSNLPSSGTQE